MQRSRVALVVTITLVALAPPVNAAAGGPQWSPPVDGPVVRRYEPPQQPFGPRHLGLDYSVPPATPVRAAGDGMIVFAGIVGGSRAVSIEHARARRTTYAYLSRVLVRPGAPVRRGDVVGQSGGTGPGHTAETVHFGYRLNGQTRDPAELFRPEPPRISLAPLDRPACPARRQNRWSKKRGGDRGPMVPNAAAPSFGSR